MTDQLYIQIIEACHSRSSKTSNALVSTLTDGLALDSCMFLSHAYPLNLSAYVLKAYTGFSKAIEMNKIVYLSEDLHNSISQGPCILQNSLLAKWNSALSTPPIEGVAPLLLPVYFTEVFENYFVPGQPSGILALYSPDMQSTIDKIGNPTALSKFIGVAYCHSVEYDRVALRRDIVEQAAASGDMNSFLHRVLTKVLRDMWDFEAGSVFMLDERAPLLRLHATTGIYKSFRKSDTYYHTDEPYNTVACFQTGSSIVLQPHEEINHAAKYEEVVSNRTAVVGFFPIKQAPDPNTRIQRHLGVLRVVNKVSRNETGHCVHLFSWEDVSLLQFVAEIMGIICHIFKKEEGQAHRLERILHGVRNYLTATIQYLNQLVDHEDLVRQGDPRFAYNMSDALSNLEAVDWQVLKFSLDDYSTKLDLQRVELHGQVLSVMATFARRTARAFGIRSLEIVNFPEARQLPEVFGDPNGLSIVFRNLIENAMKYSKRNSTCKIEFSHGSDREHLRVFISDNGIGISSKERLLVFTEGYRAENARARNPAGSGLGLAQSVGLMRAMEGDIYLKASQEGVGSTFAVKLRRWEARL